MKSFKSYIPTIVDQNSIPWQPSLVFLRRTLQYSQPQQSHRYQLMSGSSHIRSVLIGVEYRNCRRTLDVYLLFAILLGQIKSKLNYRLVTYISYKYVNQFWLNLPHPNSKLQTVQSISYKYVNQVWLNLPSPKSK